MGGYGVTSALGLALRNTPPPNLIAAEGGVGAAAAAIPLSRDADEVPAAGLLDGQSLFVLPAGFGVALFAHSGVPPGGRRTCSVRIVAMATDNTISTLTVFVDENYCSGGRTAPPGGERVDFGQYPSFDRIIRRLPSQKAGHTAWVAEGREHTLIR